MSPKQILASCDTCGKPPELAAAVPSLLVIEAPRSWQLLNLRELWAYRELACFLAWRDVMVRYKQTVLGAAWAILQPAMMMVVFTIFLGRLAKVDSSGYPYPIFVYAGLLLWMFFAAAIANAGNSIVGSSQMVSKIYFPRLLIPAASIVAALVDLAIAFLLLVVLMACYGYAPGWRILLLPIPILLSFLCALGVGSLLAALNVAYRDFKYTIPFLVQVWMFATPSIYMNVDAAAPAPRCDAALASPHSDGKTSPTDVVSGAQNTERQAPDSTVPAEVRALMELNPLTGLVSFFRAVVLGGELNWFLLGRSTLVILPLLVFGLFYFRHTESRFADII